MDSSTYEQTEQLTDVRPAGQKVDYRFISEEELVKTFRPRLLKVLLPMTKNRECAEDLVQETLIIAISRLRSNSINQPEKLYSYLASTARYQFFGWLRRKDNQVELWDTMDDFVSIGEFESDIEKYEMSHELKCQIERLPTKRDREILQRCYIFEQTKPEICHSLELSSEHYDRVVSRARKRLAKLFLKKSENNPVASYERVGVHC